MLSCDPTEQAFPASGAMEMRSPCLAAPCDSRGAAGTIAALWDEPGLGSALQRHFVSILPTEIGAHAQSTTWAICFQLCFSDAEQRVTATSGGKKKGEEIRLGIFVPPSEIDDKLINLVGVWDNFIPGPLRPIPQPKAAVPGGAAGRNGISRQGEPQQRERICRALLVPSSSLCPCCCVPAAQSLLLELLLPL